MKVTIELERVVARNVRALMALHGFRIQREFAAYVHIDEFRLSRKFGGVENWTLLDLQRLADALRVEPCELLMPDKNWQVSS